MNTLEPKQKVKLYPFAYNDCGAWRHAEFYPNIDDAEDDHKDGILIVPINPDGTIEVDA